MSDSLIKTKYSFLFEKKTYNAKLHKDVWSHVFVVGTKIDDFFDRGKELYGIFDYTTKLWTQDWNKTIELIDEAGYEAVEAHVGKHIMDDPEYAPIVLRMANTDNNLIDKFNKFVHSALGDNWKPLNQNVLFSDSILKKEDYATGTLPYPLKECPTPAYDKLMSRIYGEIETEKIEWYVGAIIQGDQKKIQKILVFYGQPGSGKSTIISRLIVDILFGGEHGLYCAQFSPEELAERGQFATAFLAKDPVVAFQDDADLSRIETNVLLNTVISHEPTKVNDKFQRTFIEELYIPASVKEIGLAVFFPRPRGSGRHRYGKSIIIILFHKPFDYRAFSCPGKPGYYSKYASVSHSYLQMITLYSEPVP